MEKVLGQVTDDRWEFSFRKRKAEQGEQLWLPGVTDAPLTSNQGIDEVMLFSGGLDSLTGAALELLREKKRVVLVSHQSATKIAAVQDRLVGDLRERAGEDRVAHLGVRVEAGDKKLRAERTLRSRSFLFAALAGSVAQLAGLDRVRFYENGVASIALPLSPQLVGSRSARTTHPLSLQGFAELLSLVAGRSIAVENPFEFLTRTEVLQELRTVKADDLISTSVSCAHVHQMSEQHPHCGTCSQCIDRRFSIIAAGLESRERESSYSTRIFRDPISDRLGRTTAIEYVDAADRFASLMTPAAFLSSHGESVRAIQSLVTCRGLDADSALRQVHELHRRHGEAVGRALAEMGARQSRDSRSGTLKEDSLLMLLSARGLERSRGAEQADAAKAREDAEPAHGASPPPETELVGEHVFRPGGEGWIVRFRGGPLLALKPSKGLVHLHALLSEPGRSYTAFELVGLEEGEASTVVIPDSELGVDQKALSEVNAKIEQVRGEIELAREMGDKGEVARLRKDLAFFEKYRRRESGPDGRPRQEPAEQKKARNAVSMAIERALKQLGKQSRSLEAHLREHVATGFNSRYRDPGFRWVV
ncbi:MAG: hypothetical protein AAF533_04705 [Acidobacteriota bacterium]